MTINPSAHPPLPSLLDRLLDDAPEHGIERFQNGSELLRDLRAGVRRDLENLLNTRLHPKPAVSLYPELRKSVLGYGLPDFSSLQLGVEAHRQSLADMIRATIECFESRLQRVRVELQDVSNPRGRTLFLSITAVLLMEPEPIPLLFDSRIHALDRSIRLREAHHG